MARKIVLHMGFLNTPYKKQEMLAPMRAAKGVASRKRRRGFSKTMTAEDVGNILEENYSIVDTFKAIYEDEINEIVNRKFNEFVIQSLTKRGKFSSDKMVRYMSQESKEIEKLFRHFIDIEGMYGYHEGIPTEAARTGRGRRTRRPGVSFLDTGVYRASFRAWADIK